jgi:hypothetical protein
MKHWYVYLHTLKVPCRFVYKDYAYLHHLIRDDRRRVQVRTKRLHQLLWEGRLENMPNRDVRKVGRYLVSKIRV